MVRERGHVRIWSVTGRQPAPARRALGLAIALCCAALALLACWAAARPGLRHCRAGHLDIRSLTIPRWALFALLAPGCGLCAIEFLRIVLRGEGTLRPGPERGGR